MTLAETIEKIKAKRRHEMQESRLREYEAMTNEIIRDFGGEAFGISVKVSGGIAEIEVPGHSPIGGTIQNGRMVYWGGSGIVRRHGDLATALIAAEIRE